MESGYSLADIRAATGDDNGFGGNNGIWWLALLFIFGMGGFNGFGRQGEYGQFATAASQQEILYGQQFGQLNDRLTDIGNGICDSTFALNSAITTEGRNLSTQLADCCCTTNRNIDAVRYEAQQNTCAITSAIHAEGEATRALIQQNEMQALRDKVSSLEMDNRMYGVVRYPNGFVYNAGASPFCGCNNGCGCNNI